LRYFAFAGSPLACQAETDRYPQKAPEHSGAFLRLALDALSLST
jgi:hypothetical protein